MVILENKDKIRDKKKEPEILLKIDKIEEKNELDMMIWMIAAILTWKKNKSSNKKILIYYQQISTNKTKIEEFWKIVKAQKKKRKK
jgi:hypothetical protein